MILEQAIAVCRGEVSADSTWGEPGCSSTKANSGRVNPLPVPGVTFLLPEFGKGEHVGESS